MHYKDHPVDVLKHLRKIRPVDMLDEKGNSIWPSVFYVESYHKQIVQEHHVHINYEYERWKQWLKDEKVWVPKSEKEMEQTEPDIY